MPSRIVAVHKTCAQALKDFQVEVESYPMSITAISSLLLDKKAEVHEKSRAEFQAQATDWLKTVFLKKVFS